MVSAQGGRRSGPDEPFEPLRLSTHVSRVRAAIEQVSPGAHGRPVEDVRAELEQALREVDEWMPGEFLDQLARSMADPSWSLKHPVQAMREWRDGRDDSDFFDDEQDDEDPVFRLLDQLDNEPPRRFGRQRPRVVGVWKRRTYDGWAYQVSILPRSDRFADKIRGLCTGYDVRVVENDNEAATMWDRFDLDE